MKTEVPAEYQSGSVKFLDCKIDLSKKPFIPRIETEFWVKKAIDDIIRSKRQKTGKLRVLDIFAGSGCIGIAILKNIKNSQVDFVDSDKRAIEQIKINLKLNLPRTAPPFCKRAGLVRGKISPKRYRIYRSNLFDKLNDRRYDLIFANPPYVASNRLKEVQPSVLKYEPKKALFGGKEGLSCIKKFLKKAKDYLKEKGIIYLEFDPLQKIEIKLILEKDGYNKFKFFKDQFHKYRWTKISLT